MNIRPKSVPGLGLLAMKLVLAGCLANAAQLLNDFTSTGSLITGRDYHTATLLPSGKVLVAGGEDDDANTFASAEVYDPATGAWTSTGSMPISSSGHTATLLPNGKVAVAGGEHYASGTSLFLSSTKLYNPATSTWTSTGSMGTARKYHTATLLPSGKVLVAVGQGSNYVISSSAELYDPATGTWSPTGSLVTARTDHTATLLPNGKVLVAGGQENATFYSKRAELYDPAQ